nr:hypothetical protein StreXyl84_05670 [Streptomyces sp. Xyl84]
MLRRPGGGDVEAFGGQFAQHVGAESRLRERVQGAGAAVADLVEAGRPADVGDGAVPGVHEVPYHRRAVEQAQRLAGRAVDVVHVVGGGTRNALLCRLTAGACGLPVVAGPAEAAAFGNVLVQARAHGLVGDRAGMRRLPARTRSLTRYEPRGDAAAWRRGGRPGPGSAPHREVARPGPGRQRGSLPPRRDRSRPPPPGAERPDRHARSGPGSPAPLPA